jgi:hypothetical protein
MTAAGKAAKAAATGNRLKGVFANADTLATSTNIARGMADGVMYKGLAWAGRRAGLSEAAVDVGSWAMRGTAIGVKGVALGYGFVSDAMSSKPAAAPSSNAFMSAAGAA